MKRRLFRLGLWAIYLTLSAAPVTAGTLTLAWNANPETDISGYQVSYGTQAGVYSTTVEVGNNTLYQVHNLTDAAKYYFVVKARNTAGLLSPPSQEINATVSGVVSLVSNASFPAPTGQALTWTALASPGLEYQFWRYSQAGGWSSVQAYSASNTYNWTPASGEQGTYAVMVWARTVGSTASLDSYRSTGLFSISNVVKAGALEADIALPASTGRAITWTARAAGGPAPLQYQFWRYREATGVWTIVQVFGASNTYSWTPANIDEGRYAVQVWVKGAGSAAQYDDYKSTGIFEIRNAPVAVATLTANTGLPAGIGTPITWKTVAAGGPGPLQYQFWRYAQSTNSWSIVQAYGSSDTYTWTPTTAGQYAVQVWVRRQGTTPVAGYEAYKSTGYFNVANNAVAITSFIADRGTPYGTNGPITWNAVATGGPGPLQYEYYLYDVNRETWVVLKPWSAATSVTWTPNTDDTGSYALQVWVKRQGSTSTFDAYATTGYFSVSNILPVLDLLVSNVGPNPAIGTPIKLTARASGGPGPLEYQFYRYSYTTGAWTLAQDYSWDTSLDWTPLPGEAGSYAFQVRARRPGSATAYDAYGSSELITVQ